MAKHPRSEFINIRIRRRTHASIRLYAAQKEIKIHEAVSDKFPDLPTK